MVLVSFSCNESFAEIKLLILDFKDDSSLGEGLVGAGIGAAMSLDVVATVGIIAGVMVCSLDEGAS